MAEYVIRAGAGFPPVPVTNIEAAALDFTFIAFTSVEIEEGGTVTDPKKLWEGNNGFIHAYGSGNNIFLPMQSMYGSTAPFSGNIGPATSTQSVFICGVQRLINDEQWVYCYFIYADDESSAKAQLNRFSGEGTLLYSGLLENSEGMLDVATPWDETPTEDESDPNNLKPQGGEHADLANFNDTEQMPEGGMPDVSRITPNYHGLVTCYMVHGGQMEKLANALFMPNFWQSLANKFSGLSDPLAMILDAYELPLELPVDSAIFKLGGIEVPDPDTGYPFALPKNVSRYRKYNMGTITLKEVFGSAKDYTDCSISIFLPYVGVKELDTDIILRNALTLYVYVDSWNGDILYLLHTSNTAADKKYYTQESVVYRWAGNCGKKIPLGRVDNSNQIIQAVSGLASIGMGAISGGAAGAAAMGMPVFSNWVNGGFKPIVQTSGGISGNSGRMDYQYAYLIIKRGVPEYPNNWRAEIGAPQYQMYNVSDLRDTGFTLFSEIQLGDMGNAIEEEKAELERLLTTEGVIL